jgi:hypothetical protein
MSAVSADNVHFSENFEKKKNSTYNSTAHLNLPLKLILVTHSSYCEILTENTYSGLILSCFQLPELFRLSKLEPSQQNFSLSKIT